MLTEELTTGKCSFVNIYGYKYLEGVIEMGYLENMVNNGGIIVIMTIGLIIAFVFKTICSFCYDEVIGKIRSQNFIECKRIKQVIEEYNNELKTNRQLNKPEYYLKSEIHKWKCLGMNLDRINNYGNIAITICLIIGAAMDLVILSDIGSGRSVIIENINKAAVYTFVPLIFLGAFKLFDEIIALDYKKNVIFDEILNYISNPREYVRFAEKMNVEEFINNENDIVAENIKIESNNKIASNEKAGSNIKNKKTEKAINIKSKSATENNIKSISNKEKNKDVNKDANTNQSDNISAINDNNTSKKSDEECVKDKELVINEVLDEFLA